MRLAGMRLAGMRLAGMRLAGMRLAGMRLAGIFKGGASEAGTDKPHRRGFYLFVYLSIYLFVCSGFVGAAHRWLCPKGKDASRTKRSMA